MSGQTTSSITVVIGATSGNVCVRACNNCGCSAFQCMVVTPMSIPAQPVGISGPANPIVGSSQLYSITYTGLASFIWTVPSGWAITSGQGTTAINATVGVSTGIVTVQACNACGCSAIMTYQVYACNIAVDLGSDTVFCQGGSLNLDAGIVGGMYLWQDGSTNSNYTVTTSGQYYVEVTDSVGCVESDTINVTVDPLVFAGFSYNGNQCLTGNSFCFTNTGTFGGSYVWDFGDGMGTSVLENPCYTYSSSGCYTVTQTITQGACNDVVITTVCVYSEPSLTITSADVMCSGFCDGFANLSVTGGTPPYTYSWGGGSGLCAGTYIVTVTDFNGCMVTDSFVIGEPAALSLLLTSQDACSISDGEATVAVSGGVLPYSYLWNDPTAQTTNNASGLGFGTYTVVVTDANGCTLSDSVLVNDSSAVLVSVTPANLICNGSCDGTATATILCGDPPFTYQWNDTLSQTTSVATGLCAGIYEVVVTDSSGQIDTVSTTITEPPLLILSISSVNSTTCNSSCDGSATVVASGGTAPYTYTWSNGCITPTCDSLCAGTISANVIDANGCLAVTNIIITEPSPLIFVIDTITSANCGQQNGSACVLVSGGCFPYYIEWSDPTSTVGSCMVNVFAGTYLVYVLDNCGCTDSLMVTISNTPDLIIDSVTTTDIDCYGDCDGTATVFLSGDPSLFTTEWIDAAANPVSVSIDSNLVQPVSGLCAESYQVLVTGANGCMISTVVTISQSPQLASTISPSDVNSSSCNGFCDGDAFVSVSGGVAPYSYAWSNGGNDFLTDSLCAGIYTVIVQDSLNCTDTASVVITQPDSLQVIPTVTNISCYGICDGAIDLIPTPIGGTPPYGYVWSPNVGQTNLCAGTYCISVVDLRGCTIDTCVTISEPPAVNVAIVAINIACNTVCDGSATAIASGGNPPYSYGWYDPFLVNLYDTNATFSSFCPGTYCQLVTDQNGCYDTACVTINEPPTLLDSTFATICANDSIFLEGAYQNTAGVYSDTLLAANGCDSGIVTTLTVNPLPAPGFTSSSTLLNVSFINTSPDTSLTFTYSWDFGDGIGTSTFQNPTYIYASPGTYNACLTMTNINTGCTDTYCDLVMVTFTGIIEDRSKFTVNIYPNPSHGQFTLELNLPEKTQLHIKLYSFTGQLIHSKQIGNVSVSFTEQLDLSGYARGIYYIQVVTENAVVTRKVIYQ